MNMHRTIPLVAVALTAPISLAQNFSIAAWSADGGGGASAGATYTMHAVIGQHDAATLSGPTYTIWGGLLPVAATIGPVCAADLAPPFGLLDLADVSFFVNAFLGQDPAADLSGNGLLDLADISGFVALFNGGCP